ncbi:hypothetical protein Pcinc_011829 [Petrolisthes cinctipes]|uniref:Uncharacterized protein n=1 Tax=Petrolisthes cinctipes TaxID=88211 RepID=A0AAE1G2A1_PETCI|nr:hypothetical protein Pcinc_011829 [Petrolisthes cinctipes]
MRCEHRVLSPSIGNDAMFEEIKLERNSSLQHNQRVRVGSDVADPQPPDSIWVVV